MIDGVTILAENTYQFTWLKALGIALIITVLLFLALMAIYDINPRTIILLSLIVLIVIFCAAYFPNRGSKTTYDVIVDDSVSWKEFNEIYEIESQHGDIITVHIKEKEEQ